MGFRDWFRRSPAVDLSARKNSSGLTGPPKTANYHPSVFLTGGFPGPEGFGQFGLVVVEEMLRDYQVRLGMALKTAPLHTATFKIQATTDPVKRYVTETLQRYWQKSLAAALQCIPYGFSASEVLYREEDGLVKFHCLKPLHPRDVRPYTHQGRLIYVGVNNNPGVGFDAGVTEGMTKLKAASGGQPAKGYWCVHDPIQFHRWYGLPLVMPSWWPWRLKVMPDGAMETAAKAFYKHGFLGSVIRHPNEAYQDTPGETPVSAQDFARQLGEQMKAGANIAIPNTRDEKGEYAYFFEKYGGESTANFEQLLSWPDWLDRQILRGMGIPDEIVAHDGNSGGYSRSNIAWLAFLMMSEEFLNRHLENFEDQILLPLVQMNFGSGARCEVTPEPLMPDEKQGQPEQASVPEGAPGPEGAADGVPKAGNEQGPSAFQLSATPVELSRWTAYRGPGGGHGWQDSQNPSDIRYQEKKPDEHEEKDDLEDEPAASHKAPAMAALRRIGEHAALAAGHAEHAAVKFVQTNVGRLPTPLRLSVLGAFKLGFASYISGEAAAKAVAKEVGGEAHADRIARLVLRLDLIAAKTLVPSLEGAAHATGIAALHGVAAAAYWVPWGSLGYLAYSSAKDPLATCRAARTVVKKAWTKMRGQQASLSHELPTGWDKPTVAALAKMLTNAHDRDWVEALVSASWDETHDAKVALALTKQALTRHGESELSIDFAVVHAPAGGVTIQGQQFRGGQFIPKDVLARANSKEKAALAAGQEKPVAKKKPKIVSLEAKCDHCGKMNDVKVGQNRVKCRHCGRDFRLEWDDNEEASKLPLGRGSAHMKFLSPKGRAMLQARILDRQPLDPGIQGMNETYILDLGSVGKAVWKPVSGERPGLRAGVPAGEYYRREYTSAAVARTLGMDDLVPDTVIRDDGSLQAFVPGCKKAIEIGDWWKFKRSREAKDMPPEPFDGAKNAARAAALDYLLANTDRHPGNWLLDEDGNIVLIDHGLTLPGGGLRLFGWSMFVARARHKRMAIPKEVATWKWKAVEEVLKEGLKEVKNSDQIIEIVKGRFDDLKRSKTFSMLPTSEV